MKGRALIVPRSSGEAIRRLLVGQALLRLDLEILKEGDLLAFPLVDEVPVPAGLGELGEREFGVRRPLAPSDYRDLVRVNAGRSEKLPRSFDVVGDIVVVRIPDELRSDAAEIGRALLQFVPGVRLVGADHGVHGAERRRSLEAIAGAGGWQTRHRENGIDIEVDLERAYFSPRLAREHARVAEAIRDRDRVYDLCCGVGPFALTIAREGRAREVTALDSNPEAVALLRTSLARQKFASPVHVIEGPVEEFTPSAEPVERVILNLPLEGIKYLPSVARTVARGGSLFFYEVTPRAEFMARGQAIVRMLPPPEPWTLIDQHVVHPYSPTSDLVAYVFERSGSAKEFV